MTIPVFGLVMTFVIWLTYELKKHTRLEQKSTREFWERESRSGFVPRKSTADIRYLTVSEDFLPIDRGEEDSELNILCTRILNFKDKPVADLSSMTNTELKERYGTANFTSLSEADTNFTSIVPLLGKLCELLYDEGRIAEAETAAVFCAEAGVMTYPVLHTLGSIYSSIGETEKLRNLITEAKQNPSCQERTLKSLEAMAGYREDEGQ